MDKDRKETEEYRIKVRDKGEQLKEKHKIETRKRTQRKVCK